MVERLLPTKYMVREKIMFLQLTVILFSRDPCPKIGSRKERSPPFRQKDQIGRRSQEGLVRKKPLLLKGLQRNLPPPPHPTSPIQCWRNKDGRSWLIWEVFLVVWCCEKPETNVLRGGERFESACVNGLGRRRHTEAWLLQSHSFSFVDSSPKIARIKYPARDFLFSWMQTSQSNRCNLYLKVD